jgi:alpha-tubulin suppressor-like RCC1 family protein
MKTMKFLRHSSPCYPVLVAMLFQFNVSVLAETFQDRPGPLAAGDKVSVIVTGDGQVWHWGYLRIGTQGQWVPERLSGLSDVLYVARGETFSAALKSDGTVWTWGANFYGQLGDDTTVSRPTTPAPVFGLNHVKRIAVGDAHALALKSDGTVWAWGANGDGQLGDGTTLTRHRPVQVPGLSDITGLTGFDNHSGAGNWEGAWVWGNNGYHQLNDGTGTDRSSPFRVIGVHSIRWLSSAEKRFTALTWDRTLQTWGGLLSDGITPYGLRSDPAADVKQVVSGSGHTLVLKADGTVWASGLNSFGELGDGTMVQRDVPVKVTGLSDVTFVAAGNRHSLAQKSDGTVWAWGQNDLGQLGDNSDVNRLVPVQVIGLTGTAPVRGLAAMSASSVFLNRGLSGSGRNSSGELGDGTDTDRTEFTPGIGLQDAVGLTAGYDHGAALGADGRVWTWGNGFHGQLGNGTFSNRYTAATVSGMSNIIGLAAADHTVALHADGSVWTWGANDYGQLGDGTLTNRYSPIRVPGLSNIITVTASHHTLAVDAHGQVWAWGNNEEGQLGDGTGIQRVSPVRVSGLSNVIGVAVGSLHSAAWKSDGTVWTWGEGNHAGQLGDGTYNNRDIPGQVPGLSNIVRLAARGLRTMALKSDGTLWAWGGNEHGALGDGTTTTRTSPIMVPGLSNIASMAASEWHSLAVAADGTFLAWGRNHLGQLANGSTNNQPAPQQIQIVTDSVGDGIPDFWRRTHFGGTGQTTNHLSCAGCDASGTGQNNKFKYVAGLHPLNPTDIFTFQISEGQMPGQKLLMYHPVAKARIYSFRYSTNLVTGGEQPLTDFTRTQITGGQGVVTDLSALDSSRFYRVGISIMEGCVLPPPGLVSWWAGNGNSADSTGRHPGTGVNGLGYATGFVGQGFNLDGINDLLMIGASPVSPPWTAEFWVKRDTSPNDSATLIGDAATALKLEQWPNTRRVGFTRFGVGDYSFNYIAPTNVWVHLVFVGTGSETRLFVNGALQETLPLSISLPVNQIGGDIPGRYQNRVKGMLDEISIYSRALTAAEIDSLWSAGALGKCH